MKAIQSRNHPLLRHFTLLWLSLFVQISQAATPAVSNAKEFLRHLVCLQASEQQAQRRLEQTGDYSWQTVHEHGHTTVQFGFFPDEPRLCGSMQGLSAGSRSDNKAIAQRLQPAVTAIVAGKAANTIDFAFFHEALEFADATQAWKSSRAGGLKNQQVLLSYFDAVALEYVRLAMQSPRESAAAIDSLKTGTAAASQKTVGIVSTAGQQPSEAEQEEETVGESQLDNAGVAIDSAAPATPAANHAGGHRKNSASKSKGQAQESDEQQEDQGQSWSEIELPTEPLPPDSPSSADPVIRTKKSVRHSPAEEEEQAQETDQPAVEQPSLLVPVEDSASQSGLPSHPGGVSSNPGKGAPAWPEDEDDEEFYEQEEGEDIDFEPVVEMPDDDGPIEQGGGAKPLPEQSGSGEQGEAEESWQEQPGIGEIGTGSPIDDIPYPPPLPGEGGAADEVSPELPENLPEETSSLSAFPQVSTATEFAQARDLAIDRYTSLMAGPNPAYTYRDVALGQKAFASDYCIADQDLCVQSDKMWQQVKHALKPHGRKEASVESTRCFYFLGKQLCS